MSHSTQSKEPESPDHFESLQLEIDAALHEGRIPELTEESLRRLCPEERARLDETRRQLELMYAESVARNRRRAVSGDTSRETVDFDCREQFDLGIRLDRQSPMEIRDAQFGRFEVLRGLGMGGQGVVFLARDPVLNRLVALKVPRPDVLIQVSLRKRFLREGRAAALLTHPNIVTVFESGEVGSVCYLTQDYIAGPSLAVWLKDHPLPVAPFVAARVVQPLAEALSLAHRQKILHRDIKPGNILLALLPAAAAIDDLSNFVPKISDFGLAKLQQDQDQTHTEAILGTPAYMSPEQAAGDKDKIGVASDIYSLGAVLYEMLTHQRMYHGTSAVETLHQVLHQDPPRPRSIVREIPLDLEAICLKCLRREPQDRYRTAQELADDLRRFMEHRPVVARPQSVWTTVMRWGHRNPVVAALSSTVILAVISLLSGSLWFNNRLNISMLRLNESLQTVRQHEHDMQVRALELRRRVYAADLHQASESWQEGRASEARQRLDACIPLPGESDLRSFPWWMLSHQIEDSSRIIGTFKKGAISASVAVAPMGDVLACGEPDGVIRLRSLPGGQLIGELRGHAQGAINALHFSPYSNQGEQLLVSAGEDGTVRVWNMKTRQELHVLVGHRGNVMVARFIGKDAEAIASGGADHLIRIWDRRSGRLLSELSGHTDIIRSLQEQPDSDILFSSAEDGTVRLWDWRSAQPDSRVPGGRLSLIPHEFWVRAMALSPDGTDLAIGHRHGKLGHWNVDAKDERFGQMKHEQEFASGIRALNWNEDETLVIGFADSRILRERRVNESVSEETFFSGHSDWILSVDDVPGGKDFVSMSKDGTIRLWPEEKLDGRIRIPFESVSYHSYVNSVLTVVMGPEVSGYLMPEGTHIFQLKINNAPIRDAWTCPMVNGTRLLTVENDGQGSFLSSFEVATRARDWQLPLGSCHPISREGALSQDEKSIFLAMNLELWAVDAATGRRTWTATHPKAVQSLKFVPQGEFVVTTCADGVVRLWNAKTGQLVHERPAHQNSALSLAVSSDGQLMATSGEDMWLHVWRITDGKKVASFGLKSEPRALAFVDDGQTLVAFSNNQLTFWSVPDQTQVMHWHSLPTSSVIDMSPDHKTIMVHQERGRSIRFLRGAP